LAAVGLIVLRPFLRSEVFYSKALFVLPLPHRGILPFAVLALLVLSLRMRQKIQADPLSFPELT